MHCNIESQLISATGLWNLVFLGGSFGSIKTMKLVMIQNGLSMTQNWFTLSLPTCTMSQDSLPLLPQSSFFKKVLSSNRNMHEINLYN